TIDVRLLNDVVTITVDTSGDGLHKRGYRRKAGMAPLRETTAAALVLLSYWNRDRPLIDPFCGSATIPIEAAMIGRNIAPGRNRSFAAEDWSITTREMWREARTEAKDTVAPRMTYPILATDYDYKVLRFARENAAEAGVTTDLHIQQKELMDLSSKRKYGCVICNPPWGHRLSDIEELQATTRVLKSVMEPHDTWSVYVLTALRDFERQFGQQAERKRKLFNGKIESTYYQFNGPRPPEPREGGESDDDEAAGLSGEVESPETPEASSGSEHDIGTD
ncbi:MAG: class I SAM-dependent RNA methyltransferase, partial [Planctomycetaceae bacterium]